MGVSVRGRDNTVANLKAESRKVAISNAYQENFRCQTVIISCGCITTNFSYVI